MSGPGLKPAAAQLLAIVETLEALDGERADISAEMRLVRSKAKADGFDVPTIKALLERRKKDPAALIEADALLETYEAALGCGAAAAGVLTTRRNDDGSFEVKMAVAGPEAGAKLNKAQKSARDAVAMAELARLAREV